MPQLPVNALRQQLEQASWPTLPGAPHLVFSCDRGAQAMPLAAPDTAVMSLICTGMLPPALSNTRCAAVPTG
jgi:hypothetical protein